MMDIILAYYLTYNLFGLGHEDRQNQGYIMRSKREKLMKTSGVGIILILLMLSAVAFAQSPNYFLYPDVLTSGELKHSVGLGLADLPEDQVEESSDFIRGPIFNYQIRYGLPENFNIYGAVNSNLITWHFSLGPRWHYQKDRLAIGLGYDIAYWFGELNQFGYKSNIHGWFNYPNLTVGYSFDKFAISLKGELILQTSLTTKSDDVEVSSSYNTFNGTIIGIYIEQPLWKDQIVLIGLKMYYAKFYYPIWAAFPTFDRYFYIPEITIGFNL